MWPVLLNCVLNCITCMNGCENIHPQKQINLIYKNNNPCKFHHTDYTFISIIIAVHVLVYVHHWHIVIQTCTPKTLHQSLVACGSNVCIHRFEIHDIQIINYWYIIVNGNLFKAIIVEVLAAVLLQWNVGTILHWVYEMALKV